MFINFEFDLFYLQITFTLLLFSSHERKYYVPEGFVDPKL